MKRLRMIVTSIVVLAIVVSAFSFDRKIKAWCVNDNGSSTCTTILFAKRVVLPPFGQVYKYYFDWDGGQNTCYYTGNTNCTATVRLATD